MSTQRFLHTGMAAALTVGLSVLCVPAVAVQSQEREANATPIETTSGGGATGASGQDAPASASERDGRAAHAASPADSTAVFEKSETVYANLSESGEVQAVYVVNRFDVTQAGRIVDEGPYASVRNLTNSAEISCEGGVASVEADAGAFFYEGVAEGARLPWTMRVDYTLDGRAVSADELAGASGELGIHVSSEQGDASSSAFRDSFVMQITFTLPGDAARDVEASAGAVVADAGQDRTVAFTVLPGKDADCTLSAQVSDFHMPSAQIVALPYSSVVELPDADDMAGDMDDLADAVSQLSEGTSQLAAGTADLASGAEDLAGGAQALG